MSYRWATWLEPVLRDAGCRVVAEPGWSTNGRPGGVFEPRAVVLHHDASPAGETSNGADVIVNGRPGLDGPLGNLWLAYNGDWHLCGAGRANHAGEGSWPGIPTDNANSYTIGIETDHTTNEQWSDPQREAAARGLTAILDYMGVRGTADDLYRGLFAHKEYAPTRKVDPDPLDMDRLRAFLLDFTPGGAPVDTRQKSCTASPRGLSGGGVWRDLQFDDDEDAAGGPYVIIGGPARWYSLTVQAYLSGPPGTPFQLRPYRTANGHDDQYLFAVRDYTIPADGTVGVDITQQGSLSDDWYLRVQGVSLGADITVTKAWAEVAWW